MTRNEIIKLTPPTTMIDQLEALLGTEDLDTWETKFVSDMTWKLAQERTKNIPVLLSERQEYFLRKLWGKHFS
jgi:hypothetical protein